MNGVKGITQKGTTRPMRGTTNIKTYKKHQKRVLTLSTVAGAVSCKRPCARHVNIVGGVQQQSTLRVDAHFGSACGSKQGAQVFAAALDIGVWAWGTAASTNSGQLRFFGQQDKFVQSQFFKKIFFFWKRQIISILT